MYTERVFITSAQDGINGITLRFPSMLLSFLTRLSSMYCGSHRTLRALIAAALRLQEPVDWVSVWIGFIHLGKSSTIYLTGFRREIVSLMIGHFSLSIKCPEFATVLERRTIDKTEATAD